MEARACPGSPGPERRPAQGASQDRLRTVTLTGIRAAQSCRADAALALTHGLLPRGRGDRPRDGSFDRGPAGRPGIRSYRIARHSSDYDTVNYRLVDAGLAQVAGRSRFRRSLVDAEKVASQQEKGIFAVACTGKPRPTATPRPVPSRPAFSDKYNCDDFPPRYGTTAQRYLDPYPSDASGLDRDGDGTACEG